MTAVELLGSDGWKSAGDYAPERASQLADLLRMSGAVVRVEGERPQRGRIGWRFEPAHSTWVGSIDRIELFVIVAQDVGAVLHPSLPGYRRAKMCSSSPVAQDMAERILDQFIMRLGVRGLATRSQTSLDTVELDTAALADIVGPIEPTGPQVALRPTTMSEEEP